jgi:hypothetical protein
MQALCNRNQRDQRLQAWQYHDTVPTAMFVDCVLSLLARIDSSHLLVCLRSRCKFMPAQSVVTYAVDGSALTCCKVFMRNSMQCRRRVRHWVSSTPRLLSSPRRSRWDRTTQRPSMHCYNVATSTLLLFRCHQSVALQHQILIASPDLRRRTLVRMPKRSWRWGPLKQQTQMER